MRPEFQQGIRRSVPLAVPATVCGVWLAACSSQKDVPKAMAAIDACGLLSTAEVHALAPGLSAGYGEKMIVKDKMAAFVKVKANVANAPICVWDDAHHVDGLMLQVGPADPSGVKKGLEEGGFAANMGYDVRDVTGLADEAAVVIQRADPAHGLKVEVAGLVLRVGKYQLLFSPVYLNIAPATAGFKQLKTLAAQAAARLRAKQPENAENARERR